MRKLGWKEGQGVGSKVKRKTRRPKGERFEYLFDSFGSLGN